MAALRWKEKLMGAAGMRGSPDEQPEKLTTKRFLEIFLRYLPYLKPYRTELVLLLLIAPLAGSIISVVAPLCTKLIIDVAFPRSDTTLLIILAIVGSTAMFLDRAFSFLRTALFGHLRMGVIASVGPQFYRALLRLNMTFHRKTTVGQKIFYSDTDVLDSSEMIGVMFPFMVQFLYQFVVVLITMSFLDWRPVIVATVMTPFLVIGAQFIFNLYRGIDLRQRLRGQELTAQLERTFATSAIPVIYSHAGNRGEKWRYYVALVRYSVANMYYWVMREIAIVFVWPSEIPAMLASFIIGLTGYWVITDDLTVGEWSALNVYILQAIVPLGILVNYYQNMRLRMVPAERILTMLDSDQKMHEPDDAIILSKCVGKIEFKDVHFQYDPEKRVLQGVSFEINSGMNVAFVGESGSGKSTILNLILRFYDPQAGTILIDDIDIRQLNLTALRRNIGIVLQEPVLFHRSIRDNILYGCPDATEEELELAIEVTRLEEVISTLPDGCDTILNDGVDLSLGQKQRVSVARCIAGDPRILLLDEPASLLDPVAQESLRETLFDIIKGRTSILISHDLTNLEKLDQIFVMDRGRIVERGTHGELLAKQGKYYALWSIQQNDGASGE